jgi:hypothetical protein
MATTSTKKVIVPKHESSFIDSVRNVLSDNVFFEFFHNVLYYLRIEITKRFFLNSYYVAVADSAGPQLVYTNNSSEDHLAMGVLIQTAVGAPFQIGFIYIGDNAAWGIPFPLTYFSKEYFIVSPGQSVWVHAPVIIGPNCVVNFFERSLINFKMSGKKFTDLQ